MKSIDPRILQASVLTLYSIISREFFLIERSHYITISVVILSFILEFLFSKITKHPPRYLTAYIIGVASSIIVDSPFYWIYLITVSMAQFSRCFITIDKKHFLNPATFGLVFVLQFFAGHAISTQRIFSAYIIPTILFLILGLITSFYARQLRISLSFILGYFLMGLLRLVLFNVPLISILGIMITPTFYLFAFHMLSDPVTAPKSNNKKIYAGATVALIDGIFRMAEIPYGQFYASLITGCIFALYLSNPKMEIVANENIQI